MNPMLLDIIPKLPMRNKMLTKEYYVHLLGFEEVGDYGDYLMIRKEQIEIHFFEFKALDPLSNYGQVYIRTQQIDQLFQELLNKNVKIHPNRYLSTKPWGQKEFALLDPDHNLLTFGQANN